MHIRFTIILALLFGVAFPLYAQDTLYENLSDACVTDYDETVDYFPDKAQIDYATGFSVEYGNNHKVVSVSPWVGAEEQLVYLLVQCGTPIPEDVEADVIVEIPVRSFVATSTTILPHLVIQGVEDRLIGVDTLMFTSTEAILERAEEIAEIGNEYSGINTELVLELEPDLIMAQQFSASGTALDLFQETGLSVVLNADFTDTSPLGQAEWGKFVALFFNTEAMANENFTSVSDHYTELKSLVDEVEERPSAIAASPYQGSWYMPAGDSYLAQLIADAGGDFLFADETGTSIVIDFEVVLERGASADYWINVNQFWMTTEDALADDSRYAEFDAFQNGNLWNNNLRQNANGGNDYFENGVANPDLLLADLIAIFHPDLLPEHEFEFYQPLLEAETE